VSDADSKYKYYVSNGHQDVLQLWGLRKQESSIQVMQNVDREKIFRKTLRESWVLSSKIEENRDNEAQTPSAISVASLGQPYYNQSSTPAKPVTRYTVVKKPLPPAPKSWAHR